MQQMMKRGNGLVLGLVLVMCGLFCGSAWGADEALLGAWVLEMVGENEPGDEQRVVYAFGDEVVHVTVASGGASMTWELAYSVEEGVLTLEPGDGLGDPVATVFSYEVTGDVLVIQQVDETGREQPEIRFARAVGDGDGDGE